MAAGKDIGLRLKDKEAELRAVRESIEGGDRIVRVEPARVRRSAFADRHPAAFIEPEFKAFIDDIRSTGGNCVPGFVRPVTGDPEHDYELASGHRRHAACLAAGLPFKTLVKRMSDAELVEHMHMDNRSWIDPSDYELGVRYAELLRSGVYRSTNQMAAALGYSTERLRGLLVFGDLPDTIVNAFPDPRRIRRQWVPALIAAFSSDPDSVSKAVDVIKKAHGWTAAHIFRALTHGADA